MSDLKILGVRVYEPRKKYEWATSLPMDIIFSRKGYLDSSVAASSCTVEFLKAGDEKDFRGATFQIQSSRLEVIELIAKFMRKHQDYVSLNLYEDTPNSFVRFLNTQNLEVIFYDPISCGYYNDPATKRFIWFIDGKRQGSLFAKTEKDALKRIKKEVKIDVSNVTFEPAEYDNREALYYFKPDWVKP